MICQGCGFMRIADNHPAPGVFFIGYSCRNPICERSPLRVTPAVPEQNEEQSEDHSEGYDELVGRYYSLTASEDRPSDGGTWDRNPESYKIWTIHICLRSKKF